MSSKTKQKFLADYQMDAVKRTQCGCILNGGTGTGKSRTGLYCYFDLNGGRKDDEFVPMKNPKDLYIITTAMKRDSFEWDLELAYYALSTNPELNYYNNKVVVDSWNNIQKYADVRNACFIFDEDKIRGDGAWAKAFLKIAKNNWWIVLSATPGDKWEDYMTIFIANGFFRTKTEFKREHIIYDPFVTKYPKVQRYVNTGRLTRLRNRILIDMDCDRHTIPHHEDIYVRYNVGLYRDTTRLRRNLLEIGFRPCEEDDEDALLVGVDIPIEEVTPILIDWDYTPQEGDYVKREHPPIKSAGELCYAWRKIVNTDESRQVALLELFEEHPRMIVFYNYNYERDILLNMYFGDDVEVAEWSGHAHQPIPESKKWVYIVQYTAGCEGWNCIKTDTIVFYSQNYSYTIMTQACGRIDRMNTPYIDLFYYHLRSRSGIDLAISKALREKKKFNETRYVRWN